MAISHTHTHTHIWEPPLLATCWTFKLNFSRVSLDPIEIMHERSVAGTSRESLDSVHIRKQIGNVYSMWFKLQDVCSILIGFGFKYAHCVHIHTHIKCTRICRCLTQVESCMAKVPPSVTPLPTPRPLFNCMWECFPGNPLSYADCKLWLPKKKLTTSYAVHRRL